MSDLPGGQVDLQRGESKTGEWDKVLALSK